MKEPIVLPERKITFVLILLEQVYRGKMSSFSDNNFVKKLGELNNTQQSIQTLSLWLIHHRKHSKTIVQVWLREMQRGKYRHSFIFVYNIWNTAMNTFCHAWIRFNIIAWKETPSLKFWNWCHKFSLFKYFFFWFYKLSAVGWS